MPRKAFVQDLQDAIGSGSRRTISNLQPGEDDGTLTFTYTSQAGGKAINIQALIPGMTFRRFKCSSLILSDVSEYPSAHQYFIYTTSSDVDSPVTDQTLETIKETLDGEKISRMLMKVEEALDQTVADGTRDAPYTIDDDDDENAMDVDDFNDEELLEPEDEEEEEDGGWSPPASPRLDPFDSQYAYSKVDDVLKEQNNRIRSDLQAAKNAGFKVGYLGGLLNGGDTAYVCISCRVTKLGISDEAMEAWHLHRRQYFVLIIQYTKSYRSLEQVLNDDENSRRFHTMRTGLCDTYKPTLAETLRAFAKLSKESKIQTQAPETVDIGMGLRELFIGRPLQDLMDNWLVKVIRARIGLGTNWEGAELYYHDSIGRGVSTNDMADPQYYKEDSLKQPTLPSGGGKSLLTPDHVEENQGAPLSFPLLAMQYVLRHLVNCTKYCLVCHMRLENTFEALRPYVCDKGLCLYQYMSLGFGPSIEHEIMSQPYVVDLLVSFAYVSAVSGRMKTFPEGLSLQVPPVKEYSGRVSDSRYGYARSMVPLLEAAKSDKENLAEPGLLSSESRAKGYLCCKADFEKQELVFGADFKQSNSICPLRAGDWIILSIPHSAQRHHCRVVDTMLYPTVKIGQLSSRSRDPMTAPSERSDAKSSQPPRWTLPTAMVDVTFCIYNQDFDQLSKLEKCGSIVLLLELLPSVTEMKTFLEKQKSDLSLERWRDRIPKASLDVLRWIIASNRSCIMQVDSFDEHDTSKLISKPGERIHGCGSTFMQFRFATGSPDKEARFMASVQEATERLKLTYPTLFAWHGSNLQNWHGIIREGLNFDETMNGRAYGHGVYLSLDQNTSATYSGYNHSHLANGLNTNWPESVLNITSAIALNEVVNAPEEFVSSAPHLVVNKVDWIQTRYLLVRCATMTECRHDLQLDEKPLTTYEQDPKWTPRGASGNITLPATAVSKSRRKVIQVQPKNVKKGSKRVKLAQAIVDQNEEIDDYQDSVATLEEDLTFLNQDLEESQLSQPGTNENENMPTRSDGLLLDHSKTDFAPGFLDMSSLPLLAPPSYATTQATRTLSKQLKDTLKVQETTPLHELGWYINGETIDNMYQWIVELHSFEEHLPLTKDMKAKGLKSIVLEIRFGKDYSFSPPFLRIIRPRFLAFAAGGGGHVTAGGALCMELLTNSGWSAVLPIENVLLQVRLALSSTEPRPARLENGNVRDYGVHEAVEAYKRACAMHGWEVPKDFNDFIKDEQEGAGRGELGAFSGALGSLSKLTGRTR